jgi:hypothetical protein
MAIIPVGKGKGARDSRTLSVRVANDMMEIILVTGTEALIFHASVAQG